MQVTYYGETPRGQANKFKLKTKLNFQAGANVWGQVE